VCDGLGLEPSVVGSRDETAVKEPEGRGKDGRSRWDDEEEAEVVVVGCGTLDTVPWFFVACRTRQRPRDAQQSLEQPEVVVSG
jgi:hypothetical protein